MKVDFIHWGVGRLFTYYKQLLCANKIPASYLYTYIFICIYIHKRAYSDDMFEEMLSLKHIIEMFY